MCCCALADAGGKLGESVVGNEVDEFGRQLRYQFPRKSTVAMELHLPELDAVHYQINQRTFASTLHPLHAGALRGRDAVAPMAPTAAPLGQRTLKVSLNGGPFIDAGVALPPAVFPWVMMTWQDDKVTLLGVERFTPKVA